MNCGEGFLLFCICVTIWQLADSTVLFPGNLIATYLIGLLVVWALIKIIVYACNRTDVVDSSKIKETLEDVKGQQAAVQQIRNQINVFEKLKKHPNLKVQHLLLSGPPGCGKTMLARAFAKEVNASFYATSSSKLRGTYMGSTEDNIKNIFASAKSKQTAVIFIDEVETIGTNRVANHGNLNSYHDSITNTFLDAMGGFDHSQVMVIAATNYPDRLDKALLSRFSLQIKMKSLREDELKDVAKTKIKQLFNLKDDTNLDLINHNLSNYSSARELDSEIQKQYNEFFCSHDDEKQKTSEEFVESLKL
ncbi:AAA family ATPase [Gammaproteobacteria bacterium]|nr:AAA family ATPase [Gammaproteobacteria bacterium]